MEVPDAQTVGLIIQLTDYELQQLLIMDNIKKTDCTLFGLILIKNILEDKIRNIFFILQQSSNCNNYNNYLLYNYYLETNFISSIIDIIITNYLNL